MQRSTEPTTLQRLVNGDTCEETGCYQMGVWLVSAEQGVFHWCIKHTRLEMRDRERWGAAVIPKLDS